jgi:predicted metal-dependent hydrolase
MSVKVQLNSSQRRALIAKFIKQGGVESQSHLVKASKLHKPLQAETSRILVLFESVTQAANSNTQFPRKQLLSQLVLRI